MAGKKKETLTFEQQIQRLEQIVAQMEKGDAELADSLALFQEGNRVGRVLRQAAGRAEQLWCS